jgi:hypothetical protein
MINKVGEIVNSALVLKLFTPFLTGSMARAGEDFFVIHKNKASVPSPHPQ